MEWLFYSLICVVFFSISQLLIKKITRDINASYLNFLIFLYSAVISMIYWIIFPGTIVLNWFVFAILIFLGFELGITSLLYTKSISYGSIAKTIPLLNVTPIFTLIIAFVWLGEIPSLIGLLGVLLIVIGAYTINIDQIRAKDYLGPFKEIFRNKASRYMFIVAVIWGFGSVFDKFIINHSTISTRLYLSAIFALPFCGLFAYKEDKDLFKKSLLYTKKYFWMILLISVVNIIFLLAQFTAITLVITAYPIAIKRTAIVLSVIGAYFFFKEKKNFVTNLIGTILMVSGTILLII